MKKTYNEQVARADRCHVLLNKSPLLNDSFTNDHLLRDENTIPMVPLHALKTDLFRIKCLSECWRMSCIQRSMQSQCFGREKLLVVLSLNFDTTTVAMHLSGLGLNVKLDLKVIPQDNKEKAINGYHAMRSPPDHRHTPTVKRVQMMRSIPIHSNLYKCEPSRRSLVRMSLVRYVIDCGF